MTINGFGELCKPQVGKLADNGPFAPSAAGPVIDVLRRCGIRSYGYGLPYTPSDLESLICVDVLLGQLLQSKLLKLTQWRQALIGHIPDHSQ
jgi:hypothetical protein